MIFLGAEAGGAGAAGMGFDDGLAEGLQGLHEEPASTLSVP